MLQRKRSQASQPMGGVRRSPFSSSSTWPTRACKSTAVGTEVWAWGVTRRASHSPGCPLSAPLGLEEHQLCLQGLSGASGAHQPWPQQGWSRKAYNWCPVLPPTCRQDWTAHVARLQVPPTDPQEASGRLQRAAGRTPATPPHLAHPSQSLLSKALGAVAEWHSRG